jgi:hypothetical protein
MITSRTTRRPVLLTAWLTLATVTALTACSSGSPGSVSEPTPTPTASASLFGTPPDLSPFAYAALVECAIHRGLIPDSVLNAEHDYADWYRDGQVIINGKLSQWWVQEKETVVKGMTLEDWEESIGQNQELPAQVCGSTAIPTPAPTT